MPSSKLNGRTVAILATDGFEQSELVEPRRLLEEAGAQTMVIAPGGVATITGWRKNDWGRSVAVDCDLKDACVEAFDALLLPGGVMNPDKLRMNKEAVDLVRAFDDAGKPVAAVCHAPIALKNVRTTDGELLVKGKDVTGFSNSEEAAVGLTDVVPELLEDVLKADGGNYRKGDEDFAPYVVVDGKLVTGQNPASSAPAATKLLGLLRS